MFGDYREHGLGERFDYFLVNKAFEKNVRGSRMLSEVKGSDHCPIELKIKI